MTRMVRMVCFLFAISGALIQPLLWVHGEQRRFLFLLWAFHKKFPWQKHSTKNFWGIFLNPGGLIRLLLRLVRLLLHTFPTGKPVSLEYACAMRVLLDLQPCLGKKLCTNWHPHDFPDPVFPSRTICCERKGCV